MWVVQPTTWLICQIWWRACGMKPESFVLCFFFLTFDVFRGSLQTLNFPLFTFYFHSLAEFFTRQADLQVLLLPLNPLSMHWFVSRVYLCIINEVGLRMTCSVPLQWGNVLRCCKASLCRNKKNYSPALNVLKHRCAISLTFLPPQLQDNHCFLPQILLH